MPVEFLSDEQVAAFGRFNGVPSGPELERFFFLDDADLDLIAKRRNSHNQLGFALQLGTVRYLGTFLPDPLEVPWTVVDYLGAQLGIEDPSVVKRYTERLPTQHEHRREIRDLYGFRDFSDPSVAAGLREFVAGRAWTHTEGQLALFNQSVAWLRRHRVLLPGASVLARLVASVREDATDRMHRTLAAAAAGADPAMPGRLLGLLRVADGQRFSELERLRRSPTRTSGRAMTAALDRVSDVLSVGARAAVTPTVPPSRLVTLARYGLTAKAPAIRLLAEPRRTATLLATAQALETAAVDDALDLFDVLMASRLISAARRSSASERLAWMPRLERASVTLARTARALLDALDEADAGGQLDVAAAWAVVERVAPREQVTAAAALVDELVPDDYSGEAAMREALAAKYGVVRPFLESLAEALPLQATPAGQDLLREVRRLPDLARRRTSVRPLTHADVAEAVVMPAWRRAVFTNPDLPAGAVDRDAYVLCVLEQLHRALRRRDVFAAPSLRWADPRARLLDGTAWQAVSGEVLTGLGLTDPVDEHLADLAAALDIAWQTLAQRLEAAGPDASVRIVPAGAEGRVRLSVERLEAIGEPSSLSELRATVAAMLPQVDLPELLLEVQAWTGFLDEYVHVGELGTRMEDLPVSVAALLVAEACNVGLTPVTKPAVPALEGVRWFV